MGQCAFEHPKGTDDANEANSPETRWRFAKYLSNPSCEFMIGFFCHQVIGAERRHKNSAKLHEDLLRSLRLSSPTLTRNDDGPKAHWHCLVGRHVPVISTCRDRGLSQPSD